MIGSGELRAPSECVHRANASTERMRAPSECEHRANASTERMRAL
jgi:hypothetical protein